jgi:hypothetical protein
MQQLASPLVDTFANSARCAKTGTNEYPQSIRLGTRNHSVEHSVMDHLCVVYMS